MKTIKIYLTLILFFNISLFANGVATITALKGSATINRGGESIIATLGAKLQEKDNVITHDNTKVQVIFDDDTVISIGKNSNFSIKEYLFEDTNEPVARFGMLAGAMRTITGKIGKIAPQKFSVETKTATIGIRGTNFSVVMGNDGSFNAYCTYGAISATVEGSQHIVKQGFFISILPSGVVEIHEFNSDDLKTMRKKNFGLPKRKKGGATEGEVLAAVKGAKGENGGQLNLVAVDTSGIVIQDIIEQNADISQIGDILSLSGILAGYTMNDALYTGTLKTTVSNGQVQDGDIASLAIDFGADTIKLTLGSENNIVFDSNPTLIGTTFSTSATNKTSSGTFTGSTGNSASGVYNDSTSGQGYEEIGTFSVTTSQVLH